MCPQEEELGSSGVCGGWVLQKRVGTQICSHFPESVDLLVVLGLGTGVHTPAGLTCWQRRDSAPAVLAKVQLKPPPREEDQTKVPEHLEALVEWRI